MWRRLPTSSGGRRARRSRGSFSTAETCRPPLWAKARVADIGARCASGARFSRSSSRRDSMRQPLQRARRSTPVSKPIFSIRVGISAIRLALPQRSPSPLSVPCTWRAPARTAASVLATAFSVSLWLWMPSRLARDRAARPSPTMRSISCGRRAAVGVAQHQPARAGLLGRLRGRPGVAGIGLVAVEEMLGVEHAPRPARRAGMGDRCRRSSRGSRRARRRAPRRHGSPRSCRPGRRRAPWSPSMAPPGPGRWRRCGPARRVMPKADEPRALELRRIGEEGVVGRIGAGPAALDVVDAEPVERRARSPPCRRR